MNSPTSDPPNSIIREHFNLPDIEPRNTNDLYNPNSSSTANFSMRPPWTPPNDSNLKWTWIEGSDPFITNGQSCNSQFEASDTESDTTVVMFNLDALNEERPEARQDQGWAKGCIPESPDSFIESLVHRVNRGRFRFELGGSSHGLSLIYSLTREAHTNVDQCHGFTNFQKEMHASPTRESQSVPAEVPVGDFSSLELLNLGAGPPSITSFVPSSPQSTYFFLFLFLVETEHILKLQ